MCFKRVREFWQFNERAVSANEPGASPFGDSPYPALPTLLSLLCERDLLRPAVHVAVVAYMTNYAAHRSKDASQGCGSSWRTRG